MNIIIHHTGGTDADPLADTSGHTFKTVDAYHKTKFNFKSSLGHYIGYHYFIDKTGETTKGRDESEAGAHTIGHNMDIGICLAGNFDATMPTEAQVTALKTLIGDIKSRHTIEKVVPHRHFAKKSCYGMNLTDDWAANLTEDPIEELKRQVERLTLLVQLYRELLEIRRKYG